MNPMDFLSMVKSGQYPQQMMLNVLQQGNNPMSQNLFNLAKQGNTAQIEQIARNLCAQRGMDFDREFNSFKQQLGIR